jgi:hypothetical protein
MSGIACRNQSHRPFWVVTMRNYNASAFNGYRRTPSHYSEVRCSFDMCRLRWRTKASYVAELSDACFGCEKSSDQFCRVCHRPYCGLCFTDHHHEGHGTPATDTR